MLVNSLSRCWATFQMMLGLLASIAASGCGCSGDRTTMSSTQIEWPIDVETGPTEAGLAALQVHGVSSGRTRVLEEEFVIVFCHGSDSIMRAPGIMVVADHEQSGEELRVVSVHSAPAGIADLQQELGQLVVAMDRLELVEDSAANIRFRLWMSDSGATAPSPILKWRAGSGSASLQVLRSFEDTAPGILKWEWLSE